MRYYDILKIILNRKVPIELIYEICKFLPKKMKYKKLYSWKSISHNKKEKIKFKYHYYYH
jgi:hypothetical protein